MTPTATPAEPVPARPADSIAPRRSGSDVGFFALLALVCLAIVVTAVLSAVLFAGLKDEVYGARVDLIYKSSPDTSDDARERILTTQRALIRSRAVLGPVAEANDMSLDRLERALSVEVGLDDLIHVTVGDTDQTRALALVQAVSSRYVQTASELFPETRRGRELLEAQIARLSARVRHASRANAAALRERIGRLQDRVLDLEIQSLGQSRPERLTSGYVLEKPLSPNPLRAAAVGLMIGLALAAGVAVTLARWRLRRTDSP
jgi:capsular polysaccharide biosynthesis protein